MSIFKCKMCGGTLEIGENQSTAVCEYCGTKQTLPKLDDEKRANLYDRANHFRRNNEFDKAEGIYEQILNEDTTDAEAYWSLVLCRYGIEYVEDPSSKKRIPTVNRAQFTSVFDDDNYKSALQYADGYQKSIYEEEANAINEIQKGILAISQKEEPFDVFICYKETDINGRRTQDSVLANDLYYQLKNEGFKVFFSRITLEDKLGVAYEPYIFAALNSAKVMVVLGTKPEYFNAVWVKNEWSRYLALVKQSGGNKIIIPAYRDMDPYDLPEEFSHLQAQDMSKLGFMQDLIRGIKKLVKSSAPKTTVKETVVVNSAGANTAPLLKRAFMFLEDGDWAKADEFCEQVLNQDPENAMAYLGKLMAQLQVRTQEALRDQAQPFDEHGMYQKALRFADAALKTTLAEYLEHIRTRNETARLEGLYRQAQSHMAAATSKAAFEKAAEAFEGLQDYRDSANLAEECYEKAEVARKDSILEAAKSKITRRILQECEKAVSLLESISGWRDADEQLQNCKQRIEELKAAEEAKRLERRRQEELARIESEKRAKRNKRIAVILTSVACVVIAFTIVLNTVILPSVRYNNAVSCMNAGKTVEAYETFVALGDYKDSIEKATSLSGKYTIEKLKTAAVGDYVSFGAYEQDNDTTNGKEAIEWLVLAKQDGKALVISKYALDCQQYNTSFVAVTWETCTLRKWLNGTFLDTAFSGAEKAIISTATVPAGTNPNYSTDPGNATQDKIFLLSINEVNRYFSSNADRKCVATAYAEAQGASVSRLNGNCWWWLRSPGISQLGAAYVYDDGDVSAGGDYVNLSYSAVRPALWIDLNS